MQDVKLVARANEAIANSITHSELLTPSDFLTPEIGVTNEEKPLANAELLAFQRSDEQPADVNQPSEGPGATETSEGAIATETSEGAIATETSEGASATETSEGASATESKQ